MSAPVGVAVLILAACQASPDAAENNQPANAAEVRFVNQMAGAPAPAAPSKAFSVEDKSELLEFAYAYPAEAAAVPELVGKFAKVSNMTKIDAIKMAKQDRDEAKASGYPFHAHSLETQWHVTADTPRLLALESETYVFTGGAHGMTGYESLVWDKTKQRETSIKAMLVSPAAFGTAIQDRFCAELDRQRAEKRGGPVNRGDDDFTKCINPMDQVLTLTSKNGKLIDGVTVIVGPYAAGPYAEGSYDIALQVDAAMRNAIKADYRTAFSGG